ncbi:MerR family transcriptional regulator [Romboutsia sp.]|uniref:MerR family transcriptional regulator n=1 Tax=Romboutsia sp. TaxID=1965302 RepID=UPI003F3C0240
MEYTIKSFADLAGISTRTLRYYDEIGLLKPCRVNSSGYRIYSQNEVDLLQQILLYRSMDMKLEDIQKIMTSPEFDVYQSLINHYQELLDKKNQIEQLISTVEKTIAYKKGEVDMSNKEKFEGLKKEKIAQNEAKYGKEIREKYGDETIEKSNQKFLNMTEDELNTMKKVEDEMFEALENVLKTKDLDSEDAKRVFEKHKTWLHFTWPKYSPEAHSGLAQMYVCDERFAKYYNDRLNTEEATPILSEIIVKYAK